MTRGTKFDQLRYKTFQKQPKPFELTVADECPGKIQFQQFVRQPALRENHSSDLTRAHQRSQQRTARCRAPHTNVSLLSMV